MKKVTPASGDYLVYFHPPHKFSNVFMRNGTYPLMFIGRVYNNMSTYNKEILWTLKWKAYSSVRASICIKESYLFWYLCEL